jgi:glycosyltransferase involved in cell wall biosynthesis
MEKKIHISIITVCLNEGRRIRLTAESIVGQSCQDFEWVVVDGGSNDGTLDILSEFNENMAFFSSEPDSGIYDAMNKGSRSCRGKYLLFLNGGDSFADSRVVEDVLPMLAHEPDILTADYFFEHLDGVRELRHSSRRPITVHRLFRSCPTHCATLISSDLFRKVGEYDSTFRIMGDFDWFLRAILVHKAIVLHYDRPLSIFNGGGISSINKGSRLLLDERNKLRKKYFHPLYGIRWLLNEGVGKVSNVLRGWL